jgi:hypothetical protein
LPLNKKLLATVQRAVVRLRVLAALLSARLIRNLLLDILYILSSSALTVKVCP